MEEICILPIVEAKYLRLFDVIREALDKVIADERLAPLVLNRWLSAECRAKVAQLMIPMRHAQLTGQSFNSSLSQHYASMLDDFDVRTNTCGFFRVMNQTSGKHHYVYMTSYRHAPVKPEMSPSFMAEVKAYEDKMWTPPVRKTKGTRKKRQREELKKEKRRLKQTGKRS